MNLFLVQHAEAKTSEEDPDRPLTAAGQAGIHKIAAFASDHAGVQVARIWNSGKTRAVQTAEILAEHLRPPLGVRSAEGMGPLDEPAMWAGRLAQMEQDVMLVGHLPHLNRLAAVLLTGRAEMEVIQFKNAGIVCLDRDVTGGWSVSWAITPQILPD